MIADYLSERKLTLDGEDYSKLRLGNFFILRTIKADFFDSIRTGDREKFKRTLVDTIKLQTGKPVQENENLFRLLSNVLQIFRFNEFENPPVALVPPPKSSRENPDKKTDRWEYKGQYMAEWIDHFARNYGWSLEQILDLDIDVAALLLQEILLENQFKKEWEYNLSELAYQYDENTKKSHHKPLKRPYWMNPAADAEIKKTKLLRSMLPIGVVIDATGTGLVSNDEHTEIVDDEKGET